MDKAGIKIIAILLSLSFVLPILSGCKQNNNNVDPQSSSSDLSGWTTDNPNITSSVTSNQPDNNPRPTIDVVVSPVKLLSASLDNWEPYIGDIETFVYGLLISSLEVQYSIFPGYVCLSNGINVYGIAYTDYNDCYTNEDESQTAFTAGFIPFVGEFDITEEEFDSGLVIHDLDYECEDISFILTYMSAPFKCHCVVYGKYLIYGVDEYGKIFYSYTDYVDRTCDESIGSLYSYDEERMLFLTAEDVGNYVPISGESLSSSIDFSAIEKEINAIIEKQDLNFSSINIESCVHISQAAVASYLLSLQEETFLGYSVKSLIEIANQLDPKDCIRITDTGLSTVTIEPMPEKSADALTKWLVGTGCVIVAAVGCVASIVFIECPPLSSLSSAMTGTAIEMFMQVVISETALENINWTKVAVSAAVGAVSGFLGPYVMAVTKGTSYAVYFVADSAIDGLLAGIETTVLSCLEGKQGRDLIKSFGTGFAIGFALSGAFKAIGKAISKIANKASNLAKKIAPNLTKKLSKIGDALSKGLYKLKDKADGTIFHSEYISEKLTNIQLARIISGGDDTLFDKSYKALKKEGIRDYSGNLIEKTQLKNLFENASDGTKLGYFNIEGETVDIIKKNGCLSILFPDTYQAVNVKLNPNDRPGNMRKAAEEFQKLWSKNPDLIPEEISLAIRNTGLELEDLSPEKIKAIIQKSNSWVLHEEIDLETIRLVPRALHDKTTETGVSHMGGYSLIGYLKSHMGQEFFERIVQAVSAWTSTQFASLERS